jgi:hypothetical protein
LEQLEARLVKVMNLEKDSLRIYVLHGGRKKSLRSHGLDSYQDFDEPLILWCANHEHAPDPWEVGEVPLAIEIGNAAHVALKEV